MDYIERPKEVIRAERSVQNNEYVQKNAQGQLNNIYDYLDGVTDEFNNITEKIDKESTYSTTETAIGTWIDGKTIYRKVVDLGEIGSTSNPVTKSVSGSYDTIINFGGYLYNPSTGRKLGINYRITSGGNWIDISYEIISNVLTVEILRDSVDSWNNYYVKVVIEYTKP